MHAAEGRGPSAPAQPGYATAQPGLVAGDPSCARGRDHPGGRHSHRRFSHNHRGLPGGPCARAARNSGRGGTRTATLSPAAVSTPRARPRRTGRRRVRLARRGVPAAAAALSAEGAHLVRIWARSAALFPAAAPSVCRLSPLFSLTPSSSPPTPLAARASLPLFFVHSGLGRNVASAPISPCPPSVPLPRTVVMAAPGTRLFIGNLSWNTTDDSLRVAFEDGVGGGAGSVTDAKVITDRYTGRSRYVCVARCGRRPGKRKTKPGRCAGRRVGGTGGSGGRMRGRLGCDGAAGRVHAMSDGRRCVRP